MSKCSVCVHHIQNGQRHKCSVHQGKEAYGAILEDFCDYCTDYRERRGSCGACPRKGRKMAEQNKYIAVKDGKTVVYDDEESLRFDFGFTRKKLAELIETGAVYGGWCFDILADEN